MNLNDVMKALEAGGTAQNRKIYERHGVSSPLFGVSAATLSTLKKKIKLNHTLAQELWATGNYDARILACKVAEPTKLSVTHVNAWAKELNDYPLTDAFAGLVAKSPLAEARIKVWIKSRGEWIRSAGWSALASIAVADEALPDVYFTPYLDMIESKIHDAPNRTRHTINNALIAIGVRSTSLAKLATAVAGRIGKVVVDHGETSCKTPDATAYIKKTRDHYARKGQPKTKRRRGAC